MIIIDISCPASRGSVSIIAGHDEEGFVFEAFVVGAESVWVVMFFQIHSFFLIFMHHGVLLVAI